MLVQCTRCCTPAALGTPSAQVAPDDAWLGGSYLKLVLANWRRPLYKKRLVMHLSESHYPCVVSLFLSSVHFSIKFPVYGNDRVLFSVGMGLSVESARSTWQANSLKESAELEEETEEWERYQDEQRGGFCVLCSTSLHARL